MCLLGRVTVELGPNASPAQRSRVEARRFAQRSLDGSKPIPVSAARVAGTYDALDHRRAGESRRPPPRCEHERQGGILFARQFHWRTTALNTSAGIASDPSWGGSDARFVQLLVPWLCSTGALPSDRRSWASQPEAGGGDSSGSPSGRVMFRPAGMCSSTWSTVHSGRRPVSVCHC